MQKQMEPLTGKHFVLGIQHLFAMFGATVLVPLITGMNPTFALLGAGLGTLLFHLITKGIVPVFLGSSFAFLTALSMVIADNPQNIPLAQGGIIVAGFVYLFFALIAYIIGPDKMRKAFPPVVTGPVIVVIGLSLSPNAINDASACWPLAVIVLAVVIVIMCCTKGFINLMPIIIGLAAGYLLALISDLTGLTTAWNLVEGGRFINFAPISEASVFIDFSEFTLPVFDLHSILLIAPVALVTFMEHIGDITINGAVVGKDFFKNPGLHRTLIGDGLASALSGFLGGPPNTTYGENTSVLAITKVYDPRVIRIAACLAIVLALFGKVGAVLQTIPTPVLGAISFVLYGMIASIGLRSLVEAKPDFTKSRNLIIVAVILVLGLGVQSIPITESVSLSGIFVCTLVGVILNLVLPKVEKKEEKKEA